MILEYPNSLIDKIAITVPKIEAQELKISPGHTLDWKCRSIEKTTLHWTPHWSHILLVYGIFQLILYLTQWRSYWLIIAQWEVQQAYWLITNNHEKASDMQSLLGTMHPPIFIQSNQQGWGSPMTYPKRFTDTKVADVYWNVPNNCFTKEDVHDSTTKLSEWKLLVHVLQNNILHENTLTFGSDGSNWRRFWLLLLLMNVRAVSSATSADIPLRSWNIHVQVSFV